MTKHKIKKSTILLIFYIFLHLTRILYNFALPNFLSMRKTMQSNNYSEQRNYSGGVIGNNIIHQSNMYVCTAV